MLSWSGDHFFKSSRRRLSLASSNATNKMHQFKKQFFQFSICGLPDISHIPLWWSVFFRISPLLTSWSSVLVLSRSWTRYHQSWEFLGLGWNEHHYGIGFTFLHFCFLWGCSGTRDCLLLWCSIKNMQPGGICTKKPPRVALCMVLVVIADNLLINKAKKTHCRLLVKAVRYVQCAFKKLAPVLKRCHQTAPCFPRRRQSRCSRL